MQHPDSEDRWGSGIVVNVQLRLLCEVVLEELGVVICCLGPVQSLAFLHEADQPLNVSGLI